MSLKYLFYIVGIITIPFISFCITVPGLGNNVAQWVVLLGILYSIFLFFHNQETLNRVEHFFIKYMLLLMAWQVFCTAVGLINFPYNNLLGNSQMSDKLLWLLNYIGYRGNDISAIKMWLSFRFTKNILLAILFSFGISLWIYHIYKGRKTLLISHTIKAVQVLASLCIIYSLLEIGYLCGSSVCRDVLIQINPLYMDVESAHGWWPPLLWETQLRSLFPEPSFLGITGSLITPILLLSYLKNKSYFSLGLFFFFSILIFLTRARTATIVYIVQLFYFTICYIFFKERNLKRLFAVLMCAVLSFSISLSIVSNYYNWQQYTTVMQNTISSKDYIEQNIISIQNNVRSNGARYTNVRVTFETALQHPIFGTGDGLKDPYIDKNLTANDLKVGEVKLWSTKMHEMGFLKSGFPVLNEFSGEFIQFGIFGLVLYCIPVLVIGCFFIRKKCLLVSIENICVSVGLVGWIAILFCNAAQLSFYIIIGILMCLLWGDENNDRIINRKKKNS